MSQYKIITPISIIIVCEFSLIYELLEMIKIDIICPQNLAWFCAHILSKYLNPSVSHFFLSSP